MGNVGKIVRRALLVVVFAGVCGSCLWLPFVTFNDLPPWEAIEVARQRAVAEGHQVQEAGSMGLYITQPDSFGGCEVEVLFGLPPDSRQNVRVRLRRSSALHRWQVFDVAIHESLK